MSHKTDVNSRSVGGPMEHATIKIKSLPELGLTTDQVPPKGEICVKGPTVFKSYYKD
jgi:long-chain acyl-CoA synthetase